MKTGERYTVYITDTNESGRGIAKNDGIVIFIPGLVSGESAEIEITDVRKNYAVGKTIRITEKSVYRIAPICRDSEKCGGCTLCHVSYEYENEIKRNTVINALRRNGIRSDDVAETVHAPSRVAYRNKVTLHYDNKAHLLGFYSEETNEVVPFSGCRLLPEEFNEITAFLNDSSSLLDECKPEEVMLKSSSDGKVSVFVKTNGDISSRSDSMTVQFPFVYTVSTYDNAKGKYVTGEYRGVKMRFSALAFRQVNDDAFSALLGIVSDMTDKTDFRVCADLYCGSGVIGLTLAKEHPEKQFYGIEINEDSIRDAKNNALENGIENIKFYSGDAASFRRNIPKEYLPDIVVVDPPRAGLSDKMKSELVSLTPERMIYVSCNPQTLARDIKYFTENGYSLKSVTPVNMFPMTKHVECVVLIEK